MSGLDDLANEQARTRRDISSLSALISSEVGAVQSTVLALRNDVEIVHNEVENARDDITQGMYVQKCNK